MLSDRFSHSFRRRRNQMQCRVIHSQTSGLACYFLLGTGSLDYYINLKLERWGSIAWETQ